MFDKAYCLGCGFVEVMAIGVVMTLHLGWLVSAVLLLTPVVLLVLWFAWPAWRRAAQERRTRVYVYVPLEQRMYPGEVTRPYTEEDAQVDEQQQQEVWEW